MPGAWIALADNSEYYQQLTFQKGDVVETHMYDDAGAPQGCGLWGIREQVEKKEGAWVRARLIAVNDPHLK